MNLIEQINTTEAELREVREQTERAERTAVFLKRRDSFLSGRLATLRELHVGEEAASDDK